MLSCGLLLCFGLSQAAHAIEGEGANRLAQAKVITGNLVRIDYGDHTVKDKDSREVHVQVTKKTQIMGSRNEALATSGLALPIIDGSMRSTGYLPTHGRSGSV
jgi:hypothetical protein